MTVLKAILKTSGKDWYPLFALSKGKPVTYSKFSKKLKSVLDEAGYEPSCFSAHSLRRGGTLWAFRSRVPETLIQTQGDWTTDTYKRYLTFPVEIRAVVNFKMRHSITDRVISF